MALIARANQTGSSFTPVPPGSHLARCYRIIDLGTQKSEYLGKVRESRKVMIQFEVHGEDDKGNPLLTSRGEPLSISKNYTLSLAESARLREDLEAWRNRSFTAQELDGWELKNILGVWGMLTVVIGTGSDGKEYTNIKTINPLPKQMKANLPEGHNPLGIFELDDPDMEMFETFSDSLRNRIMNSPEWKARSQPKGKAVSVADLDEDVPF